MTVFTSTFRADDKGPVCRNARQLSRLSEGDYSHVELPYADIDKIPNWARNSVAAMYVHKVFLGKSVSGNLIFDPDADHTSAGHDGDRKDFAEGDGHCGYRLF